MHAACRESALRARARIESGDLSGASLREALLDVPAEDRDAWLDVVLDLAEIPEDGPALPKDCVPYLPCAVDALLCMVDEARIRASDVFVDVGAGTGRAAALVHLLTGASVIALEIQPHLAAATRSLAARFPRIACVEGDATELAGLLAIGSVFFFYCPFSGTRLEKVLADLEPLARTRPLRVCAVDVPVPALPWLVREPSVREDLVVYRSTLHRE